MAGNDIGDKNLSGKQTFNRFLEEQMDVRLDSQMQPDVDGIVFDGDELTDEVVDEQTAAEIAIFEMGANAGSLGFVARRVTQMVISGVHAPSDLEL